MPFKFEKITVWQKAMTFGEVVFELSKKFPKEELYSLTSQMRRAVDSIALNIAEGAIGQSDPEQKKFIGYAMRSLAEVVTCLFKARKRKYISKEEFASLYSQTEELMNRLSDRKSTRLNS